MTFFTIVLRNLRQRLTRSVLTVAGIAIGVGAAVALTSLAWGFEETWVRIYAARGTDLIVIKAGHLSPTPPAFLQQEDRHLRTLPGAMHVSGIMNETMSIENAPIVMVFGLEPHTFVWDHLRLVHGRWPADDAERAVVLGALAADVLGKAVGSSIQIDTATFTVTGIFESASLAEKGAVVMTLSQLQRLTDQPGKVNSLNVKLAPGATADETDALRRAVASRMPGFKAYTASEITDNNSAIQAGKAISWATSMIALVVGAVAVTNTMLMSVFERMREIGILLAVGWRRRRIVQMILCESISLSVVGGALGVATGVTAVKLLETGALLRGKLEGELSVSLLTLAFAMAVGLGLFGGAYPAYRGAIMHPADALRCE